jgi:hypothetical protein
LVCRNATVYLLGLRYIGKNNFRQAIKNIKKFECFSLHYRLPTLFVMFWDKIPSIDLSEYTRRYRIIHFIFSNNESIPFRAYPPRPEECLQLFPYDPETISGYYDYQQLTKNYKELIGFSPPGFF